MKYGTAWSQKLQVSYRPKQSFLLPSKQESELNPTGNSHHDEAVVIESTKDVKPVLKSKKSAIEELFSDDEDDVTDPMC